MEGGLYVSPADGYWRFLWQVNRTRRHDTNSATYAHIEQLDLLPSAESY